MKLYQQELLDHYHNPRNRGLLDKPDIAVESQTPICGDTVVIHAVVNEDATIDTIAFEGAGCVLSQATASKLTEDCKGKNLQEVLLLGETYITQLIGMQLGPTRLQCALLPLKALQKGIVSYMHDKQHA